MLNILRWCLTDGSLWTFGRNNYGQLGDGTTHRLTPVKIVDENVTKVASGESHTVFLKNNGSVWGMGNNALYRLGDLNDTNKLVSQLIMDANVSDIACSDHGTFIFKTDGSLWAIGHNAHYRMGHNDRANHATPQMVFDSGVQAVAGGA